MGLFSKLFKKKKEIKGINEFTLPEKVEKKPEVKKEVKSEVKAEPKKEIKPEAKAEPMKEVKYEVKAEPKKEIKPEAKAEPKKEIKPEAKAEPMKEVKSEVKAEPMKEVKSEAKAEPKKEVKSEAMAEPKKEVKSEAKAEPKKEVKSEAKKEEAKKEAPAAQRTGKFEIKKTKDGRFVFNLYAPNHVIVATSQVYSSSTAAVNGIKSIINNAEKAPIEDNSLKNPTEQPFPKWEMYVDKGGQYRFRLFATNGNCVVHSQGYTAKNSCKKGIDSIIKCAKNAEIDKSYLVKKEDK